MFGTIVTKLRTWCEKHLSAGTTKWIKILVYLWKVSDVKVDE